jgi:hypothetical protein
MNDIAPAPNGALLSFIERAAKDDTFDVAKFETLLRVRRDEAHDHARRVFNAAMAACQSEMEPVLRASVNPSVCSKYAKLEAIDQQMRPIYTRHGFSVRFGSAPPPQPGWMRITCTVAHESGYFEENYLDSPVSLQGSQGGRIAMTPVQAVGSVVTYLRRYLLGMVFNIVQADVVGDDNDGEGIREEPIRAAALRRPRAERIAEKAKVYDTPAPMALELLDETDARQWLLNLEILLANAQSQDEVVEISAHSTVGNATANAPGSIKARISELLTKSYGRFAEPSDDLPDVEIEGADKVAAG